MGRIAAALDARVRAYLQPQLHPVKHSSNNRFAAPRVRRGVGKEFKGKDIEKGIAVPTCISVNK